MCLSEKSIWVEEKFEGKGFGWKVFRKDKSGKLSSHIRETHHYLSYGKWLHESNFRGIDDKNRKYINALSGKYEIGWHIFLTREGARGWKYEYRGSGIVIRKVRFKNPTAFGRQNLKPVVVAKDMFIVKGSGG